MRNCLDRDNYIARFGKERFQKLVETDSHYKKFHEPPIPIGYRWIWEKFLEIFFDCDRDFNGNVQMGFLEINEYQKCMGINFSIVEKRLLLKIKHWVQETIAELNS